MPILATISKRPQFYIPDGMERPEHVPEAWGAIRMAAGTHVDAQEKTSPGLLVGGAYDPKYASEWRKTSAGYWINFADTSPRFLARTAIVPGVAIPGHDPEVSTWTVPQLLKITDEGWTSTLDPVYRDGKFQIPEAYQSISDRVHDAIMNAATVGIEDAADYVGLAVDILSLNYLVTLPDLEAAGWLTATMVPDILFVAGTGKTAAELLHGQG